MEFESLSSQLVLKAFGCEDRTGKDTIWKAGWESCPHGWMTGMEALNLMSARSTAVALQQVHHEIGQDDGHFFAFFDVTESFEQETALEERGLFG